MDGFPYWPGWITGQGVRITGQVGLLARVSGLLARLDYWPGCPDYWPGCSESRWWEVTFQIIKTSSAFEFRRTGIPMCQNLMDLVEYGDFWVPFPNMVTEFMKSIVLPGKADDVLRRRQNQLSPEPTTFCEDGKAIQRTLSNLGNGCFLVTFREIYQ